jgi:hypothetical protein
MGTVDAATSLEMGLKGPEPEGVGAQPAVQENGEPPGPEFIPAVAAKRTRTSG